MKDGLYLVETKYFCAGFYMKNDELIYCASILKRRFNYWKDKARYIGK